MNSNEEWMDALDTVFDEEESSVFKSEENLLYQLWPES